MQRLAISCLLASCLLPPTALSEKIGRQEPERPASSRIFDYWVLSETQTEGQRAHRVLVEFKIADTRYYWNRYTFSTSSSGQIAIPLFVVDSPSARLALRAVRGAEHQVTVSVQIDESLVAQRSMNDYLVEAVPDGVARPRTIPLNEARLSVSTTPGQISALATHCCEDEQEEAAYEEWILCTSQCSMAPFPDGCMYNCEQGSYRYCFGTWTQLPTQRTHYWDISQYYDCKNVGGLPVWVNYYKDVGQCRDGWRRTWDCDGSFEDSLGAPYSCDKYCRRLSGFCQVPYGDESLGCD